MLCNNYSWHVLPIFCFCTVQFVLYLFNSLENLIVSSISKSFIRQSGYFSIIHSHLQALPLMMISMLAPFFLIICRILCIYKPPTCNQMLPDLIHYQYMVLMTKKWEKVKEKNWQWLIHVSHTCKIMWYTAISLYDFNIFYYIFRQFSWRQGIFWW